MKRSILTLLAGAVLATSAHADIVIEHRSKVWHKVSITNEITRSDYLSLVEKVATAKKNAPYVRGVRDFVLFYYLNSNGGDVETALKIGRFLRKENALAHVIKGATCYSACVFILAGAPERFMPEGGKIGIHRPYDPNDTITSANAQKIKYDKLGDTIKKYLSEMNVKPQLYDDMLYISPENVRILSKEDLDSYGLVGTDPMKAEADSVKEAKERGISRQEFGKRKVLADNECTHIRDLTGTFEQRMDQSRAARLADNACEMGIVDLGLSPQEVAKRNARADKECSHYIHQKRGAALVDCYLDIMYGRR